MAELFQRDKSTISRHIKNVYAEGELAREATVAYFATVQMEGDRQVEREICFYNLDVIISVVFLRYYNNHRIKVKLKDLPPAIPKVNSWAGDKLHFSPCNNTSSTQFCSGPRRRLADGEVRTKVAHAGNLLAEKTCLIQPKLELFRLSKSNTYPHT